jgi:hypothetical protein
MADDIDGRVQPGSGAPARFKSDTRKKGERRGECKTTSKGFFVLKHAELLKLQTEALKGGLEEANFQIEFQGQVRLHRHYVVVDYALLQALWPARLGGWHIVDCDKALDSRSARISLQELDWGERVARENRQTMIFRIQFHHQGRDWFYALLDWDVYNTMRKEGAL